MNMKRSIVKLAVSSMLIVWIGGILNGCESSAQKEFEANEQMYKSSRRLEAMRNDTNQAVLAVVSVREWEAFRINADNRLKDNEILLTNLRMKVRSSGKKSDMIFEKWINIYEQKNKFLKERITVYPEIQGDWESFTFEINKDLDELSKSLEDLDRQKKG